MTMRQCSDSKGAIILETAIAIPLITLILAGLLDLGLLLLANLEVSQITYEAARFAAQVRGLGKTASGNVTWSCAANGTMQNCADPHGATFFPTPSGADETVHDRVIFLARVSKILAIDGTNWQSTLEFNYDPSINTVRVSVTVPFRGVWHLFDGLLVRSDVAMPYLM